MICLVSDSLKEISTSIIEEQAVSSLYVRKILNTNVINVGAVNKSCPTKLGCSKFSQGKWKMIVKDHGKKRTEQREWGLETEGGREEKRKGTEEMKVSKIIMGHLILLCLCIATTLPT